MKDIDLKLSALLTWIKSVETSSRDHSNKLINSNISEKVIVQDIPNIGRGLFATTSIKPNDQLICIPTSCLLNFSTVVAHVTRHNSEISLVDPVYTNLYIPEPCFDPVGVYYSTLTYETLISLSSFQIVSLFLLLERQRTTSSFWKPFIDMLPDVSELHLCPLVWSELEPLDLLHGLLPRTARKHASQVQLRFSKDLNVVKTLLKETPFFDRRVYLWAWMCINSRCLYMDVPQAKDSSDNFTMAPYVDFLNHLTDDQCGIKISSAGFLVHTTTLYEPGNELFFSYGPHSNEFLLCEYGFTLSENRWNYVDISEYLVPLLRQQHTSFLKNTGYYNDYTVNEEGMSFRTEVVLATLQEPDPENSTRLRALVDGVSDGSYYEKGSKKLLLHILKKLITDSDRKILTDLLIYDPSVKARANAILSLHSDIKRICEACV